MHSRAPPLQLARQLRTELLLILPVARQEVDRPGERVASRLVPSNHEGLHVKDQFLLRQPPVWVLVVRSIDQQPQKVLAVTPLSHPLPHDLLDGGPKDFLSLSLPVVAGEVEHVQERVSPAEEHPQRAPSRRGQLKISLPELRVVSLDSIEVIAEGRQPDDVQSEAGHLGLEIDLVHLVALQRHLPLPPADDALRRGGEDGIQVLESVEVERLADDLPMPHMVIAIHCQQTIPDDLAQ
mmetsp:Transcript_21113/g.70322  ORF Transcript_21113/g.70322 Transcript_21113/m.70322 type:complete len:238 (+) Transcript_21113:679-1392(+)